MTAPGPPLVSVVVPVHDRFDLTRACLAALRQHEAGSDLEVIVSDDGSRDETATEAEPLGAALFGEAFRYLRRERGRGFAAAVNLGAEAARGRFLFLLNNDALFQSPVLGTLRAGLAAEPGLGAVGPLLLYPGGRRVQHLGIVAAHGIKCVHLYHLFPADHPVVARPRTFQAATMAAFLVSRALFADLGGLCEDYVNGMEDLDFCLRLKARGLSCAVVPEARMIHAAGQSPGRFDRDLENSRLLERRVGQSIEPDMGRQAARDGYRLELTPWLDPYLLPDPERERALAAAYQAEPDPARLPGLLELEPCWGRGWDLLADHLRAVGNMPGEVSARAAKAGFLPLPENLEALEKAAARAGDAARLAEARAQRERVRQVLSRERALTAQARRALEKARAAGDRDQTELFVNWLRRREAAKGPRP